MIIQLDSGRGAVSLARADVHDRLGRSMALYRRLPDRHREVVLDFVANFYRGKSVYAHPSIADLDILLTITAANAALVGAAQPTNYFSCVEWLYFCTHDLPVDGDALHTATVRLNADSCIDESLRIHPGCNLVVHEFSHVLDTLFGISGSTRALRSGYEQYLGNLARGEPDVIEDCFAPPEALTWSEWGEDDLNVRPEEEFFAVASEAFFTNAVPLRAMYPDLYADLMSIYGLDMAEIMG